MSDDEEIRKTIRIAKSVHDRVATYARQQRRSLNAQIEYMLELAADALDEEEERKKLPVSLPSQQ